MPQLTIVGASDSGVLEGNGVNSVVRTAADTPNGQTVTSRAITTAEGDILTKVVSKTAPQTLVLLGLSHSSGVDGNTVVLIVHGSTVDDHVAA